MNRERLVELVRDSTTVPFAVGCEAVGCGLTAGRAALARGEFPARTIKVGRCLRVVSADLARLLGLESV